jgi:hypothetical protein
VGEPVKVDKNLEAMLKENDILRNIKKLLEKLSIREKDFKEKVGTVKQAHKKVTDEILKAWRESNGFGKARAAFTPKGGTYGIDIVGRDWERGKILLAVEVDTWFRPYHSWMKLSDIRSENKIWIYLTNDKKAQYNFNEAINEIKALLNSRGEDKTTFGNFVAFLKTPNDFQVINIQP